jgi:hypothetical protein
MDISYTSSPAQLAASVTDARHDGNLVTRMYETLPRALGIAGVVLFLVGVVALVVFRRRPGTGGAGGPAQVDPQHDLEPVGTLS